MDTSRRIFIFFAAFLLSVVSAGATGPYLGIFSSAKGFGARLETHSGNAFDSFTCYVDMYGIYGSRANVPGGKFNYSHNRVFSVLEKDSYDMLIYFGPGCSAAYVYDFEKGSGELERKAGPMVALSGTGGLRMDFSEANISLDFSLSAELGLHMRYDNASCTNNLAIYLNGLVQMLVPQVTIMYMFK